jgi:hypothetical protein
VSINIIVAIAGISLIDLCYIFVRFIKSVFMLPTIETHSYSGKDFRRCPQNASVSEAVYSSHWPGPVNDFSKCRFS